MRKCDCGTEVNYDGYNSVEIEEGCFVIYGDAKCPNCKKRYTYEEYHDCDFNNPSDVILELY